MPGSPPLQIGQRGQLQEWDRDYAEFEPDHRHVSHLYGLYPGEEINPRHTPALAAAARRSLELRGPEGTGWSLAWKISLYARLGDGEAAYRSIAKLFCRIDPAITNAGNPGGGLYPNLLDACPPFQIDGNLGYTAGVAELLLQSHGGEISLLPALPDAWPDGSVQGLRARGGAQIAIIWKDRTLQSATLIHSEGSSVTLRYRDKTLPVTLQPAVSMDVDARSFG